jgi:hypothetical protein
MLQAMKHRTRRLAVYRACLSADAQMSVANRSWRIQDAFMEIPETQFVWNGKVSLAYQVEGEGPSARDTPKATGSGEI